MEVQRRLLRRHGHNARVRQEKGHFVGEDAAAVAWMADYAGGDAAFETVVLCQYYDSSF
jgi:hypothetical protein